VPEKKIREMKLQVVRLDELVTEAKRLAKQVDEHMRALRSGTAHPKLTKK
jgi:hypothetical protein